MKKRSPIKFIGSRELYTLPKTFLNIRTARALVLSEIILGIAGYMYLEEYSLLDAFYMVVITISTVGFAEVRQLSPLGKLFSTGLILLNIGVFAYLLAVFSYYVADGKFFKSIHISLIRKKILQLENHVIICGFGKYGQEICSNLSRHNIPFVVVERDIEVVEKIQQSDEKILYVPDDATKDEVLQEAGIAKAKALISALPDDSENLFIVLTARQLSPSLNIISRASEARSQRKLELAGADHVIMPEQIGAFYMATLVSKPGATEFFSYLTREMDSDIGIEEIEYESLPSSCQGIAIKDLHIRKKTGTNIIAYRAQEGNYVVNPSPDTVLKANSSFIVLGNRKQLEALEGYFEDLK